MSRLVSAIAALGATVALAMTTAGCGSAQGTTTLSTADAQDYALYVQPILAPGCATLDCHGDVRRPLQLYSETGLRMRDDLRDQPLTAAEVEANVVAIAGVDPDPPSIEDHVVLTKPLAVSAGGLHHGGGDLWPSRTDPAYVCVRGWLTGTLADPAVQDACNRAPR